MDRIGVYDNGHAQTEHRQTDRVTFARLEAADFQSPLKNVNKTRPEVYSSDFSKSQSVLVN